MTKKKIAKPRSRRKRAAKPPEKHPAAYHVQNLQGLVRRCERHVLRGVAAQDARSRYGVVREFDVMDALAAIVGDLLNISNEVDHASVALGVEDETAGAR